MDSPLIKGGQVTPSDLVLGCKVLSSSTIDEVLTKPTFWDSVHYYLMMFFPAYFRYVLTGIRVHFEDATSWPEVIKKEEGEGDGKGVPWVCSVIASLVKCGVPLNEVLTMPEGQAVWLHITIGINEGAQVDILSTEMEKELREMMMEEFRLRNPTTEEANECD
jgi:hypothetical protein